MSHSSHPSRPSRPSAGFGEFRAQDFTVLWIPFGFFLIFVSIAALFLSV